MKNDFIFIYFLLTIPLKKYSNSFVLKTLNFETDSKNRCRQHL